MRYNGKEVLDCKVERVGFFTRATYWLRGWVQPGFGMVDFIDGKTGPETQVTVETFHRPPAVKKNGSASTEQKK